MAKTDAERITQAKQGGLRSLHNNIVDFQHVMHKITKKNKIERIRTLAYFIWLNNPNSDATENWLKAEQLINK